MSEEEHELPLPGQPYLESRLPRLNSDDDAFVAKDSQVAGTSTILQVQAQPVEELKTVEDWSGQDVFMQVRSEELIGLISSQGLQPLSFADFPVFGNHLLSDLQQMQAKHESLAQRQQIASENFDLLSLQSSRGLCDFGQATVQMPSSAESRAMEKALEDFTLNSLHELEEERVASQNGGLLKSAPKTDPQNICHSRSPGGPAPWGPKKKEQKAHSRKATANKRQSSKAIGLSEPNTGNSHSRKSKASNGEKEMQWSSQSEEGGSIFDFKTLFTKDGVQNRKTPTPMAQKKMTGLKKGKTYKARRMTQAQIEADQLMLTLQRNYQNQSQPPVNNGAIMSGRSSKLTAALAAQNLLQPPSSALSQIGARVEANVDGSIRRGKSNFPSTRHNLSFLAHQQMHPPNSGQQLNTFLQVSQVQFQEKAGNKAREKKIHRTNISILNRESAAEAQAAAYEVDSLPHRVKKGKNFEFKGKMILVSDNACQENDGAKVEPPTTRAQRFAQNQTGEAPQRRMHHGQLHSTIDSIIEGSLSSQTANQALSSAQVISAKLLHNQQSIKDTSNQTPLLSNETISPGQDLGLMAFSKQNTRFDRSFLSPSLKTDINHVKIKSEPSLHSISTESNQDQGTPQAQTKAKKILNLKSVASVDGKVEVASLTSDRVTTTPEQTTHMMQAPSELLNSQAIRETSISITHSDVQKNLNAMTQFEQMQHTQAKTEQRCELLQLAKQKNTPFARALILSGGLDHVKKPAYVSASSTLEIGSDADEDTLASNKATMMLRTDATTKAFATSHVNNRNAQLGRVLSYGNAGLKRNLSRPTAVSRNRSFGGGFTSHLLTQSYPSAAQKLQQQKANQRLATASRTITAKPAKANFLKMIKMDCWADEDKLIVGIFGGSKASETQPRLADEQRQPTIQPRQKSAGVKTNQLIARHRRNRSTLLRTANTQDEETVAARRRLSCLSSQQPASPTKAAKPTQAAGRPSQPQTRIEPSKLLRVPDILKQHQDWAEHPQKRAALLDYSRQAFNLTDVVRQKTQESKVRMFSRVKSKPRSPPAPGKVAVDCEVDRIEIMQVPKSINIRLDTSGLGTKEESSLNEQTNLNLEQQSTEVIDVSVTDTVDEKFAEREPSVQIVAEDTTPKPIAGTVLSKDALAIKTRNYGGEAQEDQGATVSSNRDTDHGNSEQAGATQGIQISVDLAALGLLKIASAKSKSVQSGMPSAKGEKCIDFALVEGGIQPHTFQTFENHTKISLTTVEDEERLCVKGRVPPATYVGDRALLSRHLGKGSQVIDFWDLPVKNEFKQTIQKLKGTFDWTKVSKIKLSQINQDTFVRTLHNLNSEQLEALLNSAGKHLTASEKLKQLPSTKKEDERPVALDLPELQDLMADSVISLANLSELESSARTTPFESSQTKSAGPEAELQSPTPKATSRQERDSTSAQSLTTQSTSKAAQSDQLLIANPLFRFEERPNVVDVMYTDCIRSYAKDQSIYSARHEEQADLTEPATERELTSFYVKRIHEGIPLGRGKVPKAAPTDKREVLKQLNSLAVAGTGLAKYKPSENPSLPQQEKRSSMSLLQQISTVSITESTASLGLNELRQDHKDVVCKRILLDLTEAVTLQKVTVKLLIDSESFLNLQRYRPAEYIDKRLAVSLPLEQFDDFAAEAKILSRVITARRLSGESPLACTFFMRDRDGKKVAQRGVVLDYDAPTNRYLVQESGGDASVFFTKRLSLQFHDYETHHDLDHRRVKSVNFQKAAFLRLNIERMLYNEMFKLRPDLRPNPLMVNRIEKLIDLARVNRFRQEPVSDDRVRKVAEQAEAVYTTSLLKSIMMTELEEENPKYVYFIKGFKVKHSELMRPGYYALKAFEMNGGPINRLIGKKHAVELMKTVSIVAQQHLQTCLGQINLLKLQILDKVPLFEYPLTETTARQIIVHPSMSELKLREPSDVVRLVEAYPLRSMEFTRAYEALVGLFSLNVIDSWQHKIVQQIKKMLQKHYGSTKQLEFYSKSAQIDEKLHRFYHLVNQTMTAHLFSKFKAELDKVLSWFLRFANRSSDWTSTSQYEKMQYESYSDELGREPLMKVEVGVEVDTASWTPPQVLCVDESVKLSSTPLGSKQISSRSSAFESRLPFRQQLEMLQPSQAPQKLTTSPNIQSVQELLFNWIDSFCQQFSSVQRIETLLYRRIKWDPAKTHLEISEATKSVIGNASQNNSRLVGAKSSRNDAVVETRVRIEFLIRKMIQLVEHQVVSFRKYVKFHGITFEEMLYELKRQIFIGQMDDFMFEDVIEEEPVGGDTNHTKQSQHAEEASGLREQIENQTIGEAQFRLKYEELKEAYWEAQLNIQNVYDFGLMLLDCRKFKAQVIATIGQLKTALENHLTCAFHSSLSTLVTRNRDLLDRVLINHENIDMTINQIEFINNLFDEEVFEDLRSSIVQVCKTKIFLDSLQIRIPDPDFIDFLSLYQFPELLRSKVKAKQIFLIEEQKRINLKIRKDAENINLFVQKFCLEFFQFRSIGLPSREEFLASATEANLKYVTDLLKIDKEENPDEELFWDSEKILKWISVMDALKQGLKKVEDEIQVIVRRQLSLGFAVSEFPEIVQLKTEIKPVVQLWETIAQFEEKYEHWKNQTLASLVVDEMDEVCSEWIKKLVYCQKNALLSRYKGPMQFCEYILRQVDNLRRYQTLLKLLKGRGMMQTHLNMINRQFNLNILMRETCVRWFFTQDLHHSSKLEFVKTISDLALKEHSIKVTLEQTESDLESCVTKPFQFQGSYLLAEIENDLVTMRECQMKALSIQMNTYAKRFKEQTERLTKLLKQMIKFFGVWRMIQKLWAYMTPIFAGVEMEKQMPAQHAAFIRIDKLYRSAMTKVVGRQVTYKQFYLYDNIREQAQALLRNLETLMRGLSKYIEDKREYFPRLFFLSNEQIIDMCGAVLEDIAKLEITFCKMFEGIDKLVIVYREHELDPMQRHQLLLNIEREKEIMLQNNSKPNSKKIKSALSSQQQVQLAIAASRAEHEKNLVKAPTKPAVLKSQPLFMNHQSSEVQSIMRNQAMAVSQRIREQKLKHALIDAKSQQRMPKLDPDDPGEIWGVLNISGEYIELQEPMFVSSNIEIWLLKLDFCMKHAVSRTLLQCYKDFEKTPLKQWIGKWPTQFTLLSLDLKLTLDLNHVLTGKTSSPYHHNMQRVGLQKMKTQQSKIASKQKEPRKQILPQENSVERTSESIMSDMKKLLSDTFKEIDALSSMILEQLSNSRRTTLNSLIINRVHARDVIIQMIDNGVEKSSDFLHKVQISYYINEQNLGRGTSFVQMIDDHIQSLERERQQMARKPDTSQVDQVEQSFGKFKQVQTQNVAKFSLDELEESMYPACVRLEMLNAKLVYGYEFLSNQSRLVITPLTEKVFQSLFLALHYQYGGAPVGPVGTGKTESIKELSKMSARHCYVFNCQSSIEIDSMTKFFKGLASNGSWVCFDEFNRLKINLLSVISQLIINIQKSKTAQAKFITIDGSTLKFQINCAPFITMNPFFVGRTPMPDNLMALFRQITMVVPNVLLIAEIILYNNGFLDARNLALKLTRLFEIMNDQLKFCAHYDFGLRSIKAILTQAGKMKLKSINVPTAEEIQMDQAMQATQDHLVALKRVQQDAPGVDSKLSRGATLLMKGLINFERSKQQEPPFSKRSRTSSSAIKEKNESTLQSDPKLEVQSNSELGLVASSAPSQEESQESLSQQDQQIEGLNLPFLKNELGCTNPKVLRDRRLIDQFLLMKALIDGTVPKLLFTDIKIFQLMCEDIFHEVPPPELSTKFQVRKIVEKQLAKSNLCVQEEIVQNVLNLIQATKTRHGLLVTGPTMSGKSTAVRTMVKTLQVLNQEEMKKNTALFVQQKARALNIPVFTDANDVVKPVNFDPSQELLLKPKPDEIQLIANVCLNKGILNQTINPKAVSTEQLMGRYDETSREWTDGLLSAAIRAAVNDTTGREMLVTFDGPIEPDWVENINSVLDDNKRLNLITGEVIFLTEQVKVLLEASDLTNVSPATISRCAIIYFPKEQLPIKALFNSWLLHLPPILQDQKYRLDQYFNFFMPSILDTFLQPEKLLYPVHGSWAVNTFLQLLESLIVEYRHSRYLDERAMKKVLQKIANVEEEEKHALKQTLNFEVKHQDSLITKTKGLGDEMQKKLSRQFTMAPHMRRMNTMAKGIAGTANSVISQAKVKSPEYKWTEDEALFESSIRFKKLWIDSFFIYALIWAFGSILTDAAKNDFNKWLLKCFEQRELELERLEQERLKEEMNQKAMNAVNAVSRPPSADSTFKSATDFGNETVMPPGPSTPNSKIQSQAHSPVSLSEALSNEADFIPAIEFSQGQILEIQTDIPRDLNVFDLFFDIGTLSWQSWRSVFLLGAESKNNRAESGKSSLVNIFVTQDFWRYQFLMQRMFIARRPLLFLGLPATGKSTILRNFLRTQDNVNKMMHYELFSCSAMATFDSTREFLERPLIVLNKNLMQPQHNRSFVFMFDDINMSLKDKWGSQGANELVRQWLNYGGWFQPKSNSFRRIKEINFAATVSIRAGRKIIDERLGWHFATIGFANFAGCHIEQIYKRITQNAFANCQNKDIQQNAPTMLFKAAMDLLDLMKSQISLSPTNFLLQISQRHLFSLLTGFIDAIPTHFAEFEDLAIMWVHEVCRVVLDRHADETNKQRLFKEIKEVASSAFKVRANSIAIKIDSVFFSYGCPEGKAQYRPLPQREASLQHMMQQALLEYNSRSQGKSQLDIVFFHSVIEKVIKINRSFHNYDANTILVALEGSGSFELVKVAIQLSDLLDYSLYEKDSELEEDWRLQLKEVMLKVTTARNRKLVLHVEERDLASQGILEALNALAAHSEIFALFTREELTQMIESSQEEKDSILTSEFTQAQLLDKLRSTIKENLTILLQLSPRSNILLQDMRNTTHFVNSSTVIQFGDWNRAGFEYMAKKYFSGQQLTGNDEPGEPEQVLRIENLQKVILCQVEMHLDCEIEALGYQQETGHYIYVSPQLFENFIRTYKRLLARREKELIVHQQRFLKGYEGIQKCVKDTEVTQEELSLRVPILVGKQRELEAIVQAFRQRHSQISEQKELMIKQEVEVTDQLREAEIIYEQIERVVKNQVPQFVQAMESLQLITRKEIEELQSIQRPTETLKTLSEAVCVIMRVPPTELRRKEENFKVKLCYWSAFLGPQLLGNFRIVDKLTQIDPQQIDKDTIKRVDRLLRGDSMSEEKVKKSCVAAKGIFQWVNAIKTFYAVYNEAAPNRDKLIVAGVQLNSQQEKKKEMRVTILALQEELRAIRTEQKLKEDEIQEFQKEIDMCYFTRSSAARLLNELNGEMQKWRVSEIVSRDNLRNLEGDCLLAAAMVTYLAPFTQNVRRFLFSKWLEKVKHLGILHTENLNFNLTFADPLVIKKWLDNGLPNDSFSIENAIILNLSIYQPILIDPQLQAVQWLKKQYPDIKNLNIDTSRFMQELKLHCKFGATVIIENVGDHVPRKLHPLFSYAKQNSHTVQPASSIYLDKQLQPIDANFKLFIASSVSSPDFGSELSLMANFINFNVTLEAFEAQILALLLQEQERELDQKQKFHRAKALKCMKQLREVEDVIMLEVSRGKETKLIIEGGVLTEKLVQSRMIGKAIGKNLIEIKNSMSLLMRTSHLYKPLSVRAAKFYYLIADLVKLNNMYQFTHEWFKDFFVNQCVRKFEWGFYKSNREKEKGVIKLCKKMTKDLFEQVTRTLFQKDVMLFAFLLAYQEMDSELKCDMRHVEFFIKGNLAHELALQKMKPAEGSQVVSTSKQEEHERAEKRQRVTPWITLRQWEAIDRLSMLPPFNQPNRSNLEPNLASHIENNSKMWFNYVNEDLEKQIKSPETSPQDHAKAGDQSDSQGTDDDDDDEEEEEGEREVSDEEDGFQDQQARFTRRSTIKALSLGIPGFYEDFSYTEAQKVASDLQRQKSFVKNRFKIGLAKRLKINTEQLEKQLEDEELDEIFKLDLKDCDGGSSNTSRMQRSDARNSADEYQLENLSEGYESHRKNNETEDARIAQTIINGVQEYTEFKVRLNKRHSIKRIEKQLYLDKDLIRLCIMRCFHPDKLMQEIRSFITKFLGKSFIERPVFVFPDFLQQVTKRSPVLFMTGANVNSYQELEQLISTCDARVIERTQIEYEPLGSSSSEKIAKLIIRAACKGTWLLLDNLQLSLEMIPDLVKFLETMFESEKEEKERLKELAHSCLKESKFKRPSSSADSPKEISGNDALKKISLSQREGARTTETLPDEEEQCQDGGSERALERIQLKNSYRTQKRLRRQHILQEMERFEIEASQAIESNEHREPSESEISLKEFIFPVEEMAFPVHKHFRLWLSTIPVANFPKEFARRCKLVSRELPSQIRPSTLKALGSLTEQTFDSLQSHKPAFKKLLFSLTVMHAVVNQRERFNSFGWSSSYVFSPNDWKISIQILEEVCNQTDSMQQLPMEMLRYLVGELNYGGKLIYQEDRDILKQTLHQFVNQDVINKSGMAHPGAQQKIFQIAKSKDLYDLAVQKIVVESNQRNKKQTQVQDATLPQVYNYQMPCITERVFNMEKHVRDFFPLDDLPQIFGLHPSATSTANQELAHDIMSRVYKHQFVVKHKGGAVATNTRTDKHTQLLFQFYHQKLIKILSEIPAEFPKSLYEQELCVEKDQPMVTLLIKELQRYNLLLACIKENLIETLSALEGDRQHDETTEETFECLQTERTPKEWIKFAYPCHTDMTVFLMNLKKRVEYIGKLVQKFTTKGRRESIGFKNKRFWLPGFFNPKNFLVTLLSQVSRREGVSLERLKIKYKILQNHERTLTHTKQAWRKFQIYGLWLQGAKWSQNQETICDLELKDPISFEMPTIQLEIVEFDPLQDMGNYELRSPITSSALPSPDESVESSFHTDSEVSETKEVVTQKQQKTQLLLSQLTSQNSILAESKQQAKQQEESHFMCPLYVNFMKNRTVSMYATEGQLIGVVPIKTKLEKPEFWIQRGVCLLCYADNIDEK